MSRSPLFLLIGCHLLCSQLQATTWIVDASGGPGSHFTTLSAACSAASDGDVIRVRAGSYRDNVTTSKSLAILAAPGASLESLMMGLFPALTIDSIPAGRSFVLSGFSLQSGPGYTSIIDVVDCQGSILLADLTCVGTTMGLFDVVVGVRSLRSTDLAICDSHLSGGRGLYAVDSMISASSVSFVGESAMNWGSRGTTNSYPGVELVNSTFVMSGGSAAGGDGAFNTVLPWNSPPQPGIGCSGCALWLAGDASTSISAGSLSGSSAPAISGTGSLTLDPRITLAPTGGAAPVSGLQVISSRTPQLVVQSVAPGTSMTVVLLSPAGDLFEIYLGLPSTPLAFPGVGLFFLDPGWFTFVTRGVQGPSGQWSQAFPVPAAPDLIGLVLRMQGLSGTLTQGILFSTPGTFTFR